MSPADATFEGKWDIDANSKVTVKGISWPVAQLLDGSPYQNAFEGRVFAHMFLHPDDYHRYHVPVAGEIIDHSVSGCSGPRMRRLLSSACCPNFSASL